MERKIGEIFTCDGKIYQVVKGITCVGCCILHDHCFSIRESLGPCADANRSDKTGIIFKEINNMENNQLTINIPEGMEIDVENSDLKTGVIMFKKKFINFNDVRSSIITKVDYSEVKKNQNKLDAINKLMNIASYYNGDWKPDWGNIGEEKYFIIKSDRPKRLFVDSRLESNYGCVYFRSEADAQAVIDNPNFRSILDEIFKK